MNNEKLKEFNKLTESFIDVIEKMNLNEGWWDTSKASAAGTKGSIKGLGQQIKGGFNKAVGNVANKGINYLAKGMGADPTKSTWAKSAQNLAKQGQSQIDTGKQMGYNAKYNTYIDSTVNTLISDLEKLNIPIANKNKLIGDLKKTITTNTQASTGAGIAKKAAAPTPATAKLAPNPISTRSSTQTGSVKPSAAPAQTKAASTQSAPKVATSPQKSMEVPTSSTGKMLGAKGMPKALQNLKPGQRLAANGRQIAPDAEQSAAPTQKAAPKQQPAQQTNNQAGKQ